MRYTYKLKELAKELCEKSGCHHKCNDTKDCVVEDEALLLINENKSNNFDVKSNNEIEGLAKLISKTLCIECGQKPCEECKWYDENVERTDCTDCLIAEHLYNAGYRKQSEGEWIRRYSKHTDHLGTFMKYDGDFCSVCGELGHGNYCSNCGARMRGEKGE